MSTERNETVNKWGKMCIEFIFGWIFVVAKLTFIIDVVILGVIHIVQYMRCKDVTDGICRDSKNYCSMKVGWVLWLRMFKVDYFKEKIKMTKEITGRFFSEDDVRKFKGTILETETNEVVIKALKMKYKDRVKIVRKSQYKCWQPIEKLYLINPCVMWKNILNLNLYRTLFRMEKISRIIVEIK